MPFVPVIFNVAALFIGSGWSDYRYYWPTAIMSIFLFMYVMGEFMPKTISGCR